MLLSEIDSYRVDALAYASPQEKQRFAYGDPQVCLSCDKPTCNTGSCEAFPLDSPKRQSKSRRDKARNLVAEWIKDAPQMFQSHDVARMLLLSGASNALPANQMLDTHVKNGEIYLLDLRKPNGDKVLPATGLIVYSKKPMPGVWIAHPLKVNKSREVNPKTLQILIDHTGDDGRISSLRGYSPSVYQDVITKICSLRKRSFITGWQWNIPAWFVRSDDYVMRFER